ncbi:MAG: hypothetical protein IPJ74_11200 [Saprospiraceae bacterium]|nr:hypothetical protein [Saprospiraceae bacterium]
MKNLIIVAVALSGFIIAKHLEITRPVSLQYQAHIAGIYYIGSLHIMQKDRIIFTQTLCNTVPPNALSQEFFFTQLNIGKPTGLYRASLALQIGFLKHEKVPQNPNENNYNHLPKNASCIMV